MIRPPVLKCLGYTARFARKKDHIALSLDLGLTAMPRLEFKLGERKARELGEWLIATADRLAE